MIRKRKILLLLFFVLFLSGSGMYTGCIEVNAAEISLADTDFYNPEEYEQVMKAARKEEEYELFPAYYYDYSTAYKMYRLKNPDFLDSLERESDIESLLSDEYAWILAGELGNTTRIAKKDGEWTVLGYSSASPEGEESDVIQVDIVEQVLNEMQETQDGTLPVVKCFDCPMYYTNFVYIRSGDDVRLIPFGCRSDFSGLTNGQAYAVSEVYDIMSENFSDRENGLAGILNGGSISSALGLPRHMHVVIGIILAGIGVVTVINPSAVYRISENLKGNTANGLSKLEKVRMRIRGCAFILIGLVSIIFL